MPEGGLRLDTETVEVKRQEVNRWIRTSGEFDSLVDFDEIARDPTQPSRLKPEFDSGTTFIQMTSETILWPTP